MKFPQQALLLFLLNFFDAVLTIVWVRNGYATEGNHLMASLLDLGNTPFLGVKMAIGAVTAFVLWKWNDFKLAKYGLTFGLAVYTLLMVVHFLTGLSAAGILSEKAINNFSYLTSNIFALFLGF